jgi:hypothetical protein
MFKSVAIGVALLLPCLVQAQQVTPKTLTDEEIADRSVCLKTGEAVKVPPGTKIKEVKPGTLSLKDQVVPLALVVCEVENALDTYQQEQESETDPNKILPKIISADFDFKTVVDTKGSLGIGLFIFKLLGGSIDKQKTDEVDFQYVPKSLLKTAIEARKAQTFQDELLAVIENAALALKQQREIPIRPNEKDPLVFKQLSVTVNYGVTKAITLGVSIPVYMVTITGELDKSKNSVQSVKLVFGPPPKPGEKP